MSTTHPEPKLVETITDEAETRGIRWSVRHVTRYRGRTVSYYRAVVSGEAVALGAPARHHQALAVAAVIRLAEADAADRDASDRATAARIAGHASPCYDGHCATCAPARDRSAQRCDAIARRVVAADSQRSGAR